MLNVINNSIDRIWQKKIPFFVMFFVITMITYGLLVIIDFIPDPVTTDKTIDKKPIIDVAIDVAEASTVQIVETKKISKEEVSVVPAISPLPIKIIIDKLDKEVVINNPTESTIASIDAELLNGVVRHPDSADFKKVGNIFLLGHSSYLPNVFNKNFQAFNGIQKLTWGDKIRVQSADTEFIYFVEHVRKEKATEAIVPYTWGEANLTLVTCNSFGTKEDRFIVEAKLVAQKPL